MQGQKRVWGESQEYDPFAGLCEKRPVRVIAALRYEVRKDADCTPAWTKFLYSTARRTDKPKIAALIARGLSNRGIADELVISSATVARHVANMLIKLGFSSRAQIAAWVARQPGPGT